MKKFWKKKRILIPAALIFLLVSVCFLYVNDYYHSEEAVQGYFKGGGMTEVTSIKEGIYVDGPGEDTAVIFYPGAKVEYTAYLPLLHKLAERGMDCFLVKMPCNLAFLGQNKAEKIIDSYEYKHWYLSGHSLGGAMAASYASKHLHKLDGLILLAAYPTQELKAEGFSVLSLYGSKDGVLNKEKLEAGRKYMPSDYTEICLEGGNHAWFGNYGDQKGDQQADISREDQQERTVDAVVDMVKKRLGKK
ncbi:alpha/beta fold hydrolase [Lachnospiraceae bacterium 45-W7]